MRPGIHAHHGHHHHHDHSHPHPRCGVDGGQAELVEVTRAGLVESVHYGSIVVAEPSGRVVKSVGYPATPTFMRSAAKPIQALAVITSGAAERFGFSDRELAAMCGSLNGEPFQVEVVLEILEKIGLGPEALQCGVHRPSHRPTAQAMAARGEKPTELHNNCAGKHAAMLAICVHNRWPVEDYTSLEHPVQQLMLDVLAQVCAYPREQVGVGIDGCGVAVFRVPLMVMAGAYARLARPEEGGLTGALKEAAEAVMRACLAHPEMIAGSSRLCTRLMQAAAGRVLAKTGAEGSYAMALGPQGLGVGIKVMDGAMRALGPVCTHVLHCLGEVTHEQLEGELADLYRPVITNHRAEVVGEIRAVFEL